jgi:hypothetical protein
MDLIDEREVQLPAKRSKPSSEDLPPAPTKLSLKPIPKQQIESDHDSELSEIDEGYLDSLEKRLDEKLGKGTEFEDILFMKSPHDSIVSAEGISSTSFKKLTEKLSVLPDGEELIQFAEFLAATKA